MLDLQEGRQWFVEERLSKSLFQFRVGRMPVWSFLNGIWDSPISRACGFFLFRVLIQVSPQGFQQGKLDLCGKSYPAANVFD